MTETNELDLKKRRYPRLNVPVLYKNTKIIGQKHKAPNISLGGMRIYSNSYYQKGQSVNIELSLPSGQTAIALTRVAWIDSYTKDSNALYDIGLKFIHIPPNVLRELKFELENKENK